jgi:hypothetical protein
VYKDNEGTAKFKVPKDTEYMDVPTEHWPIVMRRRPADGSPNVVSVEEQWPCQIKFK